MRTSVPKDADLSAMQSTDGVYLAVTKYEFKKRCLCTLFNNLFLEPQWVIDSEAMTARGIIGLVQSN